MNLLFIGDIFGSPGRSFLKETLPGLINDYRIDLTVANGENSAGGAGITARVAAEIFSLGVDVITSGNHIWNQKEIFTFIESEERIVRPANYPPGAPGRGSAIFSAKDGSSVGIVNVCGRLFSPQSFDCPFRALDEAIARIRTVTPVIFVDFHGEAPSEKIAAGWHVDGRVSALLGTHTHVQTADEIILPRGTAYITDTGMTGSYEGVIGAKRDPAITHFLTQLPARIEPAGGKRQLNAVYCSIHPSGRAERIERILIRER